VDVHNKISVMPKRIVAKPKKRGPYKKAKRAEQPPGSLINNVALWRMTRGYTIEELADKSGLSTGQVNGIENGTVGFSSESLAALSAALDVPAGFLLSIHPTEDAPIWEAWRRANPDQRRQLAKMAEVVVPPKEEGR
jgi:transcriptional regulator with XRE-family HTH domain